MDKSKLPQHICAFVIFTSCIVTVVLLLTKCKVEDHITDILEHPSPPLPPPTTSSLAIYWAPDVSLLYKRSNHEAVLLANGKVMVAGGRSTPSTILRESEFYCPSRGWQSGPMMRNLRFAHTLTLFDRNTKVLATGSANNESQSTAEIYDSATNRWRSTSTDMFIGRFAHAATLLNNEQILIMGGIDNFGFVTPTTELYDPSYDSFILAAQMNIGRILFTATLLNDGSTVLVTGGADEYYWMSPTAELYRSGSWEFVNNFMIQPRAYHAAVLLADGNVLIAGGGDGLFTSFTTAEIYNTTTHTFHRVGSMKYRRAIFTLTLLPSGKVLATGGIDWRTYTYPETCELYDPITQTWSDTHKLNNGRYFHRSILLADSVLTIGGYIASKNQTETCEKYQF